MSFLIFDNFKLDIESFDESSGSFLFDSKDDNPYEPPKGINDGGYKFGRQTSSPLYTLNLKALYASLKSYYLKK